MQAIKLGAVLACLAGLNILVAFGQLWYVITRLGPGMETDALFAGMVIPQLVLAVVSGSLMHVLVPLLAAEDVTYFRRDAWGFLLAVTGLFAAGALMLALLAHWWVPVIVPGFSAQAKALTVSLTRIQLLGMVFTASVSVLWSVSHAKRRFIWAESSPVMASALSFAFLVWALPRYGVTAAAWSAVIAPGLQVAFLMPGIGRPCQPDWGSPAMVQARKRLQPLLVGTIYYKTDPAVDRFLASMAPAGGLSLLHMGMQMFGAANQIINKAIAAPMVPDLAVYSRTRDWHQFRGLYKKRLYWVLGFVLPGYLVFLVIGEPFLRLVIGYGVVNSGDVHMLWLIMASLGGSLIGGAVGNITSVVFYATADVATPTRLGIWTYTIYIPFKILAFYSLGVLGLAISTSIFVSINALLQYLILEMRSTKEWIR